MNRDIFIKMHWRRYPAQSGPALDIASFIRESRVAAGMATLVGGRLRGEPGDFSLTSGESRLAVKFLTGTSWDEDCVRDGSPEFREDMLRDGDLICVRVASGQDGVIEADRVKLLFAARDPRWREVPAPPFHLPFSYGSGRLWHRYMELIRSFFSERGFIEAQTPTLVSSPGTEPFLDPFSTQSIYGGQERQMFLPTSPEFHLKKLLAADWARVFELKTCFRNNEGGSHHQPEFMMLEWYRSFAGLEAIAEDVEALLTVTAEGLGFEPGPTTLQRVSIADLFEHRLAFKLRPDTTLGELRTLARHRGIPQADDDTWDDIFFRVFLTEVEPALAKGGPWLVYDYPPSQAALARINSRGWADRFEIYWKGYEIANAFHELNDPDANRERFEGDLRARAALGRSPVPVDEELVRALYEGMPPSGGIALGADRLFMAVTGIEEIEKTRPFPHRN